MAGQTGGGKQVVGFLGIGMAYFRSKKFLQADGGWYRVVWMPKELKEKVLKYIPEDMRDKIATEEDAKTIDELKEFLKRVNHPVVKGVVRPVDGKKITEGWEEFREKVEEEKEEKVEEEEEEKVERVKEVERGIEYPTLPYPSLPALPSVTSTAPVIRIIIKNAKITIDKVIVKKVESDKGKKG